MTSTGTSESSRRPAGAAPDAAGDGRPQRSFLAELPVLVLIAFVLALLLKTFLIQAFYIPSASMEPTLLIGDRVLVNKLAYRFREPRRGEIVVFAGPEDGTAPEQNLFQRVVGSLGSGFGLTQPGERDFIKRIIGLPGETIAMRDGVVTVDGRPVTEAPTGDGGYLMERDLSDFEPTTVPDGHYFMMGDNRLNSSDSRFPSLGTIRREDLVGRAFVTIWPVTRLDVLPIADYPPASSALSAPAPAFLPG